MILQELKSHIDDLPLRIETKTSSDLTAHLNELVDSGGKKFRPGLLYLIGKLFHLDIKKLEIFARSAELTHLASLIHDDVIDKSDQRRNAPTLNALKNNSTAILAGDFLLASIISELALQNENQILIDLTTAIKDLADGEWLQFNLKSKSEISFEDLREVSIKKTGSLIRWCCQTPGRLAGYHDLGKLSLIGEKIGLIFQMADDIVDGLQNSGKPAFLDILNGQINFVSLRLTELFPELKVAVYELRRGSQSEIPWTKNQYLDAMKSIDNSIEIEKNEVLKALQEICEEKNSISVFPLFEMMINKIQLNYQNDIYEQR
jgi:geranylgeranyl pyrophosphate synthase